MMLLTNQNARKPTSVSNPKFGVFEVRSEEELLSSRLLNLVKRRHPIGTPIEQRNRTTTIKPGYRLA
jgi:hypothetical protein